VLRRKSRRNTRILVIAPSQSRRDNLLYLAARRHLDVRLLVPRQLPKQVDYDGSSQALSVGPSRTLTWLASLQRHITQAEPDLIHFHGEAWAITAQRLLRHHTPLVIHGAENVIADAPLSSKLRRLGIRRTLAYVDGYLSWGTLGLQAARAAGLPPTTPQGVIPASPPDPEVFKPPATEPPSHYFQMVHAGRLVPEKGVDTILHAMNLSRNPNRLRLEILGTGPEEKKLRALAAQMGLRVHFRGSVEEGRVSSHVQNSHAIVAASQDTPTWKEQWGRTVAEAMATGRPVIVSDSGELPRLVGHSTWVFRQGDAAALARTIDQLATNDALWQVRSQQSLERASSYHPHALALDLADFWIKIIDSTEHSGGRRTRSR
jgi:glycosyltransferase involved in cell wall biosynthesis